MEKFCYPGRGIVIGIDEANKHFIQVYWLMGRSENSRNRVLKADSLGKVWIVPADPKKVKDPSLIIYTAMRETYGLHIVSNGCQTDTIMAKDLVARYCGTFRETMFLFGYEPDEPNFTPRISAICSLREEKQFAEMAIINKSDRGADCDRHFYSFSKFEPGMGYCITTYKGFNKNPLPAFEGPPYRVALKGDISVISEDFWDTFDEENCISPAVKLIDLKTGASDVKIINKYVEVI